MEIFLKFLGITIGLLLYESFMWFLCEKGSAKASGYNCENCRNWACQKHRCDEKRGKLY